MTRRDASTRPSSTDDQHETWAELAAGHSLLALEPADEQVFLAHLDTCRLCQQAQVEHRATLAHLAAAADAGEPPAELLLAIRAAVEDDVTTHGLPVTWPAPAPAAEVASLAAHRRRRPSAGAVRWAISLTAAAASVVLISSLAVANNHLQHQKGVQAAGRVQLEDAVQALTSSRTQQVQLSSVRQSTESAVAVVDGGQAALVVSGFHPNDARHTYVLWETMDEGSPSAVRLALKTFDVTQTGVATIKGIRLPSGSTGKSVLQVTEEKGRVAPAVPGGFPFVGSRSVALQTTPKGTSS